MKPSMSRLVTRPATPEPCSDATTNGVSNATIPAIRNALMPAASESCFATQRSRRTRCLANPRLVDMPINVTDDVPVLTSASVSGTVDEGNLNDGQSVGNDAHLNPVTATGSLSTLVSVGADEPGSF